MRTGIDLLPVVADHISDIRITADGRQLKRRALGDRHVCRRGDVRRRIAGRRHRAAHGIAIAGATIVDDLPNLREAARMEVRIAVRQQVVVTDASVGHDRRATAGFHCRRGRPLVAADLATIPGVAATELMTQFMGHEINIENVAARWAERGIALRLGGAADIAERRDRATTTGTTNGMAEVVIGDADRRIDRVLDLSARLIRRIRQRAGI